MWYKTDFKPGDIIEYANEQFEVIKNYGHSGLVKEYFGEGNYGDQVNNFWWEAYGERCKLVRRKA